jgi:WD40-like Beta Propeller Repeat
MCYKIILTVIFCMTVSVASAQNELVKATNLDKLNTADDEEDPCPTQDGKELLYASNAKGSYGIFISKRASATAAFGAGKVFIFDKLSDQRCPMKFQDKYYFASNEIPDEKFAKLKNFDLRAQIGTQKPFALLGDVNTKDDEMYPWVTPAGKEFYFSRKVEGGWKLFVANGPVPGPIGKAKEVGFPVNFHRATVAGKGLVMYLQGPLDNGKIGLYRSSRDKIGEAWSKPAVVTGLNHPDSKKGDMQPALSADGTRLYFVSDRPGGKGGLDIWTVTTAAIK